MIRKNKKILIISIELINKNLKLFELKPIFYIFKNIICLKIYNEAFKNFKNHSYNYKLNYKFEIFRYFRVFLKFNKNKLFFNF